jgi:hypothetical protein
MNEIIKKLLLKRTKHKPVIATWVMFKFVALYCQSYKTFFSRFSLTLRTNKLECLF